MIFDIQAVAIVGSVAFLLLVVNDLRSRRLQPQYSLLWLTLAVLVVALLGALWIQRHAPQVARRTGALPPGAARAVPPR